MTPFVIFMSGHAIPAARVGLLEPKYFVSRSRQLEVRAGSMQDGDEPIIMLSTKTYVSVEYHMLVSSTGEEVNHVQVGATPMAHIIQSEQVPLAESAFFTGLSEKKSVKAELFESMRRIIKYHSLWHKASSEAVTGLVKDGEEERSPEQIDRMISSRIQKMNELLQAAKAVGVQSMGQVEDLTKLLALLDSKKIDYDTNALVNDVTQLPVLKTVTFDGVDEDSSTDEGFETLDGMEDVDVDGDDEGNVIAVEGSESFEVAPGA